MSCGVDTRQVQSTGSVMMLTNACANITSEEWRILREKVSREACKCTKSQTRESRLLSAKEAAKQAVAQIYGNSCGHRGRSVQKLRR